MLEELLEQYKDYEPNINYFSCYCHGCNDMQHPIGWHCSIRKEPLNKAESLDDVSNKNVIHMSGFTTALDALKAAIEVIK